MAGLKALIFSVFAVFLLVIGILNVIINNKENKCEMTWMFEQPEYLKIPMPKAVNEKFPNYGLYVYGEGQYARLLSNMKPFGIPVLFIPGNAGSHKQARSLASVAFRRANDKVKRYHFNFFTVGLNEELSGLYGPHLQEQTEFVRLAIKKIFSLYKTRENQPTSIVLVGHSMGGMIARGLFTLPNFDASLVNTIFMQASPNQAPVIMLDPQIGKYHERVNDYWRRHGNTTLGHITLVSSGGGDLDIMVRGGLTHMDGIVDEDHGLSTTVTHIPKAWVPTDHKCIVWCKQVVLAFVRSLFDIVDEEKFQQTEQIIMRQLLEELPHYDLLFAFVRGLFDIVEEKKVERSCLIRIYSACKCINMHHYQITEDVSHRMAVFRHHFLQHPGTSVYLSSWQPALQLDDKHAWTLMTDAVWKWEQKKVTEQTYLAMPLANFEDVDHAVVVANVVQDSWICYCTLEEGKKQCSSCQDLSSTGSALPPLYSNKKVVHMDLNSDALADATHIVIVVEPTDKPVEVVGEVYRQDTHHVSNSLPGLMEVIMALPESVTKGALVLDLGNKVSFFRIKLYNLNSVLKVYTAHLQTSKCTQKDTGEHAGSVMRFTVPWSNEDVYQHVKYGQSGNLSIKVQHIPPAPVITGNPLDFDMADLPDTFDYVELFLHLDPTCSYKLRFSASFTDMLAQFVRFYGAILPAFCVATLLMTLTFQLKALAKDGRCPSVLECLWETKPYVVVPVALLTQFIIQLKPVQSKLERFGVPVPDIAMLDEQGISFRGAQLVLYLLALCITTLHAGVISLVTQILSRVLGPILAMLPAGVWKLVNLLIVLLFFAAMGLSAVVCGTLGIFVCYVVTFVQCIGLCYSSRTSGELSRISRYHVTQAVFMLLMWLLILNSPPLIVWWKAAVETEKYQLPLTDPSRLIGVTTCWYILALHICVEPLTARSSFKTVAVVTHALVTQMLVFSMVTMYRVSYFILAALFVFVATIVWGKVKSTFAEKPKTD